MALACHNRGADRGAVPCGACAACRKIEAGLCPDVMWITRPADKSSITVDTVRELRQSISVVPNDLAFKVYIISDAHTMNQQAQNALLLTLEEPPPFVIFLLLTEDAGALLETIRSRAPTLRMQPVCDSEMRNFLLSDKREPKLLRAAQELTQNAPADFDALITASGGAIGKALELLDEKKREPMLQNRALVTQLISLLAARAHNDELLLALYALGNSRDEVGERLALLEVALRDLMLLGLDDRAPLLFFTNREEALDLADRFTATRLLAAYNAIEAANDALLENANLRLTLTRLFTSL
jgi:DNA polymerase-3 subunit delta'